MPGYRTPINVFPAPPNSRLRGARKKNRQVMPLQEVAVASCMNKSDTTRPGFRQPRAARSVCGRRLPVNIDAQTLAMTPALNEVDIKMLEDALDPINT